ncbi:uncharacterized protein [Dermacentor andersoni]|uniref:uncharacterized protein n=1 Tax=Dermacentor andersoni TaxID=34620 RepID=UPI002155E804|nr:uncharacterized protein LOC126528893 [Dermacentor andersoni]XP_054924632.1 uncharacterized protein LOC129383793 [Dermacentor andersoni]
MASITKRDRAANEQSTNDCTSSHAASRPLSCATQATSGPEAEESEPMDTTSATCETRDHHGVQCQNECVHRADQAASCDKSVQVDSNSASALLTTEKAKWKRKERDLRSQILRLHQTIDKYKEELKKLQEDSLTADVSYIRERAAEKEASALFLVDQITNYKKKRPTWSEETTRRCVVLRHLSTKAYEHIRGEMLLKLPDRKTLTNYIGTTSGETGFSKLVETRLICEAENFDKPQSKVCSLIVDEMRVKQKLQYNKQRDCFVGQVDIGVEEQNGELVLANSLLCFVISGLTTKFRIPVAYYFTKGLTGPQLHKLLIFVMQKVEACGFRIVRLVTDNHKVNVNCMKLLGNGLLTYRIEHPCDRSRILFISFDPCHVLKNVRSQFLSRDIGPKGEISASHIKDLYELQKGLSVKPVRFLSRKHVYPSNIEKMNVARAVQLMSPSVTAALEHLKDQAGHTCALSFSAAGPTITFMKNVYRWFVLHDVSNTTQHIRHNFSDGRQFDDSADPRLEWLEVTFPMYLETLKKRSGHAREFLTAETYEAILLTTYSTVACVRYLLTEEKFSFVLTRKFNSDPIESLFGSLRMSSGCNDMLDVRAALSGLEKLLKTGIAVSNAASNIAHKECGAMSGHILSSMPPLPSTVQAVPKLSRARLALQRLNTTILPQQLSSLQISATAYVGGYIARVVGEHIDCENCVTLCTKPVSNQPLFQLTRSQDRGGLLYPSDQLLFVLDCLRDFADRALQEHQTLQKPLTTLVEYAVPALCSSKLLKCKSNDSNEHRLKLMNLISVRFLRPLLCNYAFNVTDRHDAVKHFVRKPLSRKHAKL